MLLKITYIELIYSSSNSNLYESDVKVITIPKNTIFISRHTREGVALTVRWTYTGRPCSLQTLKLDRIFEFVHTNFLISNLNQAHSTKFVSLTQIVEKSYRQVQIDKSNAIQYLSTII